MRIILGSNSERKVKIAQKIFNQLFGSEVLVEGYPSISRVPETPYGQQTFDGARNRAVDVRKNKPEADFWLGLESGLVERYGHLYEEAWATIINKDGEEYYGYSSGLKVPDYVLQKMGGLKKEHCDAMSVIEKDFGTTPNDTWGTYSGGVLLREISLEESLRNALVQIIAPEHSMFKK